MSGQPITAQLAIDANATRYLSGIGLIALFYDHLLTFSDEVQFVWKAKGSLAKYLFLLNRYAVLGTLSAVAYYMNHFSGPPISDAECRRFFGTSSIIGVISVGIGNVLILMRVVALWDNDKRARICVTVGFCLSFTAALTFMIVAVIKLLPYIIFVPILSSCTITQRTLFLTAVWASPMSLEIVVLVATALNALNRPRHLHTPLTKVLHRDGIQFFLALTFLRTFNLVLSIFAPAPLIMLGAFFVWAMTTVVLNRSLLRIQQVQCSRIGRGSTSSTLRLGRITSVSTFHLDGDAYVYGASGTGSGYGSDEDDEEERREKQEREESAMRKRDQLMLWNERIQMHSRLMSGDVSEASLTRLW